MAGEDRVERELIAKQKNYSAVARNATSGSADTREAQLKTAEVQAKLTSAGVLTPGYLGLTKPNNTDNPFFIYPGDTFRDLGSGRGAPQRVKVERGFIRRLDEFYKKMTNAPTIFNRRCNFQFQPDTIVRTVSADAYNQQYFFNQDPAQLAVPIPGQATYSFKLLFNREAELVSKRYRSGNGLVSADVRTIANNLKKDPEFFIENDYDPSWVCGIGVLADIMCLDAVVGQGFNKEMLNIVKQISEANKENPPTSENNADDEDKENTDSETQPPFNPWTDLNLNPNLGNTAFITPVPVRVVLSKWMIIEGFINSTNVNFHKFTKDYIPSQASVEVTMQALYIGFEKKETMLTQVAAVPSTDSSGDADSVGPEEKNAIVLEQTQQGIDQFFKSVEDQGKDRDSLNDIVFTNSKQNFDFKMDFTESSEGQSFRLEYEGRGDPTFKANPFSGSGTTDGEVTFFYDAVIKMYWYSYAKGADQNDPNKARTVAKGRNAPSGSTITPIKYDEEFPSELEYLKGWGTKNEPFIITSNGEIRRADLKFKGDKWVTENTGWTFVRPRHEGLVIVPYENEQFVVELTMRLQAKRFESGYKSKQVVKGKWTLRLNEDSLFKNLSISNSGWPENL